MNSSVNSMPLYVTEEEASILRDGLIFLIKGVNDAKLLVNDGPVLDSLDGLAIKYKSLLEKLSVEEFSKNEGQEYAPVEFFIKGNDTGSVCMRTAEFALVKVALREDTITNVAIKETSILKKGEYCEVSNYFRECAEKELATAKEYVGTWEIDECQVFFDNKDIDEFAEEDLESVVQRGQLVVETQNLSTCGWVTNRSIFSIIQLEEV